MLNLSVLAICVGAWFSVLPQEGAHGKKKSSLLALSSTIYVHWSYHFPTFCVNYCNILGNHLEGGKVISKRIMCTDFYAVVSPFREV